MLNNLHTLCSYSHQCIYNQILAITFHLYCISYEFLVDNCNGKMLNLIPYLYACKIYCIRIYICLDSIGSSVDIYIIMLRNYIYNLFHSIVVYSNKMNYYISIYNCKPCGFSLLHIYFLEIVYSLY